MSSSRDEEKTVIIGKGSYGIVRRLNNFAVKTSEYLNPFIQELIVLKYMNYSNYTLNLLSYNLSEKTFTTTLYDCSLDKHIEFRIGRREKEKIFTDVLKGLSDMHSRGIIHSDLKLSNILINLNPVSAVLCDFGLSSIESHARTYNVAPISRPDINFVDNEYIHDMFGLCVSFVQVFGDMVIKKRVNRRQLRRLINKSIRSHKIKEILLSCVEDEAQNIPRAIDILDRYYNIHIIERVSISNRYKHLYIENNINNLYHRISSEYAIENRSKLGCRLFTRSEDILCESGRNYSRLFCLHIVIYLMSCLYKKYERRERRMSKELIMSKFSDKSEEEFYHYIEVIIEDEIALNILVSRKFKKKR